MSRIYRAIDLCAGGGGWACAARGLPIKVELAVDFWEPACTTYRLNHPETEVVCGDLRDAAVRRSIVKRFRGVDLLLGGIPCEWLSTHRQLNKVKAPELAAQRATLDAVLDLVKEIDPTYWCLEDVKGLIRELPPMTPWLEINSRNYSAQRRKRVYVGFFPAPETAKSEQVLADKVRPGPYRVGRRLLGRTPQMSRTFSNKTCLAAHLHLKAPTVAANCSRRDAELGVVDERLPGGLRQLEWQEQAILQGFPTDYLFYGSPTDVAKVIGRAVQIDTARTILASCVRGLKGNPRKAIA